MTLTNSYALVGHFGFRDLKIRSRAMNIEVELSVMYMHLKNVDPKSRRYDLGLDYVLTPN